MPDQGLIIIGFDGVIAHYEGWDKGKIGPLLPGVRDTIATLRNKGKKVVVWTSRNQRDKVSAWLETNEVKTDGFFEAPRGLELELIIDDVAFRAENRGLDPTKVVAALAPAWKTAQKCKNCALEEEGHKPSFVCEKFEAIAP